MRRTAVATGGIFLVAATVAAQPMRVAPGEALTDWRLVAPVTAQVDAASVEPEGQRPDEQPADSFEQLRLRVSVGETVSVVDASGQETRGRIATLSDVALALTVDQSRRTFAAGDVRRIDRRRRDSVGNGLLIGAGAGGLLGFWIGRSADSPECPRPGIECGQGAILGTVSGALWGAVGGWITDRLIRKRETVYAAHDPE